MQWVLRKAPRETGRHSDVISAFEAYLKHTLISIGTNGFTKALYNRHVFSEEVKCVIGSLKPSGIIIYGPAPE